MKRVMIASVLALAGIGCASSYEVRQAAYSHQEKARMFEAQGDYQRAAKERAAADKQFRKANERAYDEARAGRYYY